MAFEDLNNQDQENQIPDQTQNPFFDMLSKYQGSDRPSPTVNDILAPQNDYEQQARNEAARSSGVTGPQAFSTYYPSMENNIQKGYYSGSMIGSNPLFAPASLFPYGLVDARQQALKAAADKKVAEMDAYKKKIQDISNKPPSTKHSSVNPYIKKKFYDGLNDWIVKAKKENPNSDPYQWLNQNPDFHKWMQGVNDLAKYEDQGADAVAKYEEAVSKGEIDDTPQNRKKLESWYRGDHIDGAFSPNGFDDLGAYNVLDLPKIRNVNKLAEEVGKSLPKDVIEGLPSITKGDDYDTIITKTKKAVNGTKALDAIKLAYETNYAGKTGAPDLEKFTKAVLSRVGEENTVDVKTASKHEDKSGLGFIMTAKDLKDGETEIVSTAGGTYGHDEQGNVIRTGDKRGTFGIQDYYPLPAGMKPFDMATTTNVMDIEGNNASSMIGNRQVIPSGVGNVYKVYKDGSPNNGKAIKESQIDQYKRDGYKIYVTPVAILTVLDKDGKDAGTVTTHIDDVSNGIEQRGKDGKYTNGVNVDLLKNRAQERQKEINKAPSVPTATKEQWKKAGWSDAQIDQGVKLGKISVK